MRYLCLFLSVDLWSNQFSASLVSRVSSLLCLYSVICAEIPTGSTPHGFARSKWLRGVKIRCKTTYFTYFDHHLQFISDIRRITSHFMLEAAMRKLLCLQLRPIFALNKPCFFHITTLANPRLLLRYLQKSLNKVLKVFVLSFSIYPQ